MATRSDPAATPLVAGGGCTCSAWWQQTCNAFSASSNLSSASLICLCSSILPSAVKPAAAHPRSSSYQAKIFHFLMHSSHTVWLSLFFPQVPWCYLFLFLISYVLSHTLPSCFLFLKLQLDSTFGTQRFIYINLKKCLEKHIPAKKQTWNHNEMCCWVGKGPPEQSAPIKSIKRGLLLISKWYLIHFSGFSLKDLYS